MLSPVQIEEFFRLGYVVQPGVFSPEEIRGMREAFERLERLAARLGRTQSHAGSQFVVEPLEGRPHPRIHRIVWCGGAEPLLSRLGRDPRLVNMAGRLLGSREMSQLINQAHFKLPGDGVEFPWHQDSSHRRYGGGEWTDVNGRGSYVQTATAVDDMTEDNGPLEFIPGSCRLGHIEPDADGRLPPKGIEDRSAVQVTLEAGSVVLFGPYTVHRSLPNRSSRPRRVFINGFAFPGANSRVYPGEGAGRLLRAS